MKSYSNLQKIVIMLAQNWLKKYYHVDCICLDRLCEDSKIRENQEEAVFELIDDTLYWEGKFA